MESRAIVICSKCYEPIVSGEGFGFACFKIPGQEGYHLFHRRFPGGDCWEVYMVESGKSKNGSEGCAGCELA